MTIGTLVIALALSVSLSAQTRTVTGTVTDEANRPVVGVNIFDKAAAKGTTTGADGSYTLPLPSGQSVLTYSMIGYEPQEIVVGVQTAIDVKLVEVATELNTVVVVGYGTARKKDVTGAVARVNGERFALQANKSPVEMLRGTVAGVTADLSDPRPGANTSINIRGNRSLTGSNSALVVLDGMIYNGNISDINPADIEAMDVLKDVSSSAIYGSRGANGVIMITTKRGKTEKPTVTFNAYWGAQDYATKLDMESPEEYMDKRRLTVNMKRYRGQPSVEDPDEPKTFLSIYEYEMYEKGQTVNGLDLIKQNSLIQNYDVNIAGRTKKVNYYLSGGYGTHNGIVKGDNFNRYSFRSNVEATINPWFKAGLQAAFTGRDQSGNPADRVQATRLSPYAKIYHEDGEYVQYPMYADNGRTNPLLPLRTDSYKLNQQLTANIFGELTIPYLPGFSYRINWMNRINNYKDFYFTPEYKRDGATQEAVGSKQYQNHYDYTLDNIIKYTNTFDVHTFDVTLLYSYTKNEYETSRAWGNTFPISVLGYDKINLAENQFASSGANGSREIGMMGRINYRLMDRYLLTATIRRDGASKFAKNKRWGNFPSLAAGWIISEENWLQDTKWLDILKLRLSWGKAGNQYSGLYDALSLVGSGDVYIFNGSETAKGIWSSSMANDNLTWETTTSVNFGVDFGLFRNRLSGSVEYYNSNTTDLLVDRNIPIMSGYKSIKTNMGKVNSYGVEVALNGDVIRAGDFTWNMGITWSMARNKIKSLYGLDSNGDGREDDDVSNNRFIGQPTDAVYGYEFIGIVQEGETYLSDLYKPGYAKFSDLDDSGDISANADRKILERSGPDWRGSVLTTFTYKGWELSAFFNIRKGGLRNNPWYNPNNYLSQTYWAPNVSWWTPENPSNSRVSIDYPQGGTYPGTFLKECTYVRLQDLTLSYSFPERWLNKINVSNLRLYANAKNLFTFTDWFGWDPEPSDIGAGAFPMLRTYTLGVSVSF